MLLNTYFKFVLVVDEDGRDIIILLAVVKPLRLKPISPNCCAKTALDAKKPDGGVHGVLGIGDSTQNSIAIEPITVGDGRSKPSVYVVFVAAEALEDNNKYLLGMDGACACTIKLSRGANISTALIVIK